MGIECIVLDFDGTFTLVDHEAIPFLRGFRKDFDALVGPELSAKWDATVSRIQAAPDQYGWEYGGQIVAPSHADPYILATTVGQILLAEAGIESASERSEKLSEIYRKNYPDADTVFRPEAKSVVETVLSLGLPVYVVTNSQTAHVEAKLAKLAPKGISQLHVRGDARKFVIGKPDNASELFDELPETQRIAGLSRPIYMRRGKYLDALRRIWEETGAEPASTLVCGDIYELDLALPAQLGANVHLVCRESTAEYEKQAVRALPSGTVSNDLNGLLERLSIPG